MAATAVQDALAEGVDAERLECAAHEIGHALAWLAGGFTVKEVVIRTGWFGGISDAECTLHKPRFDERNIDAYLIGLAGGKAGQVRHLSKHQGRAGWSAGWSAEARSSWDRKEFRWLQDQYRTGLTWVSAVAKARRIIDSQAANHDRLTVELARSRRLSGWSL